MLKLLKIEWLKVKNYRTFWILAALYLLSIWGANYIGYTIQQKIYESKQVANVANMILGAPPYAFPRVWQTTANISSFILFIAGLLMIILVTNEYSYKTHRQNVIDGLSRTQFITTKLALGVIIALASTIVVFITAIFFGLLQNPADISFANSNYLFYFFIQALSYTWMAILFGLVFKRSGIAIGIFFLYTLIIENVLVLIFDHAFPDTFFLTGIGKYFPIQSTDELIPTPVFEPVQKQLNLPEVNIPLQLVFAFVYLAIYFFISKRKFETSDL